MELLKTNYTDRQNAQKQIIGDLESYYRSTYPEIYTSKRALVDQSAESVTNIYLRNIYPDMNVTWGVHPNNLGHNYFPGCFRVTMVHTLVPTAPLFRMIARLVTLCSSSRRKTEGTHRLRHLAEPVRGVVGELRPFGNKTPFCQSRLIVITVLGLAFWQLNFVVRDLLVRDQAQKM